MTSISFPKEYFSPEATLGCGQVFRYVSCGEGYLVLSKDKACILRTEGEKTVIDCQSEDRDYFYRYFDPETDYAAVCRRAKELNIPVLSRAVERGKGIRILRQDPEECIFSFIVSQQNNIPRIRGILFRLAQTLGEKREFAGKEYFSFPSPSVLAARDETFYRGQGLGYRAKYISETARILAKEGLASLKDLHGKELKKALLRYPGVGSKVADCVALFAFHETSAFPVDTWIARLYREDFGGEERDREKINAFFEKMFGEDAGIFQQYLFFGKREENRSSGGVF